MRRMLGFAAEHSERVWRREEKVVDLVQFFIGQRVAIPKVEVRLAS